MTKLYLSIGHGGSDPGAVVNGIQEKDINLVMGLAFLDEIKKYSSIEVKASRMSDIGKSLAQRAQEANDWGADYYLSIHNNAGGGDGFEAIHSIFEDLSEGDELARHMAIWVKKELGQNIRRVFSRSMKSRKDNYYGEIRMPLAPAVILEGAFMDTKDFEAIDTKAEQEHFGRVYAKAFAAYVGAEKAQQSGGDKLGRVIALLNDALKILSS